jgi:hypothetical protein
MLSIWQSLITPVSVSPNAVSGTLDEVFLQAR